MKKKFKGFTKPTYTQTPNEVFDILLDMLNGSELKVLLYIIRRTFGFKKDNDNISLNQIVNGIKKKDGSVQDYGTGISLKSVKRAVKGLSKKNVIIKIRRKDESGKDEAPNYSLNIIDLPFKNKKDTFMGFTVPNYTLVPDEIFDNLLSKLSGSELKTLLFITRQTFGYSKESENISLNRMLKGYIDREGNVVYKGAGLGKPALLKTLKSLHKKMVIIKEKRYTKEKGYESTNYKLNIKIEPRYENDPLHGNKLSSSIVTKSPPSLVIKLPPPLVKKIPPQLKIKQYKNIQQHVVVISKNGEKKTLKNLLDLNIDRKIAKSLLKKHGFEKINTYIKYLKYKLDKGFKPKESIAAFLVDSIVNSYILPENFKEIKELEKERKMSAKKCYESIKGDCIASKTLHLYPFCPYCEKISKNIDQ